MSNEPMCHLHRYIEQAVEDCLRERQNGERYVEQAVVDCLRERQNEHQRTNVL